MQTQFEILKKPSWLRRKLPSGPAFGEVAGLVDASGLHTVCREAACPNRWECYSNRTATFLILGPECTRNCRFCAVGHGPLQPPDPGEPEKVAEAARSLGLAYVVVTSVTRDDLPDGGAGFFSETILAIRNKIPDVRVEVLIPDFLGDRTVLETVLRAKPDALNHNIETVLRLYPEARAEADYERSLDVLRNASAYEPPVLVKSGLMLGLGETSDEIRTVLTDLLNAGCHALTLGQYLQPSKNHLPVKRFVPPEEFDDWRKTALQMGFRHVASGPFVRSSYHAKELYKG